MARITLILTVLTTVIALLGGFKILMNELRDLRDRKRLTGRWFVLALLLCAPDLADAACTGSGLVWSCTAGSTAGEINTAISSASDNAVITFANGSYSATGISLNPRNGLTLICATVQGCTMSGAQVLSASHTTTMTNLTRISGFIFSNASGGPTIAFGYISGDPGYTQLRIDHNKFQQSSGYGIATGFQASIRSVLGVIDHNTFEGSTHDYPLMVLGGGNNDWGPRWQGTVNNLFLEDNVFNYGSENLSSSGMDSWQGGRFVVRYNTITNARVAVHGICHNGPANLEIYGNLLTGGTGSSNGYRIIHHQGSGEFMVFSNTLAPTQATMALLHYRSSNPNPEGCGVCNGSDGSDGNRAGQNGYPCYRQPGRTGQAQLVPIYLWNNRFSGNGLMSQLSVESAGGTSLLSSHIQANRDYYEAVSLTAQTSPTSPFNGTTGMGYGTLANRPTTCTPTPQAADAGQGGVGYWATDVGTWKTATPTQGVDTGNGVLYHCSASNTWTVQYTPYTYPHPLIGGTPPVEPEPPPVTRFYLRFAELAFLIVGLGWKLRGPLLAGSLLLLHLGGTLRHAVPEYSQRTVYQGKVLTAKVLLSILPRRRM